MWDYLDTFDEREVLIAHYIKQHLTKGNLFDLDCGKAPLVKHLPSFTYYGNDILNTQPPIDHFYNINDFEVRKTALPPMDVIVLMGMGGYELTKEPAESPTVRQVLWELVQSHEPKLVIQECIEEFEPLIVTFNGYEELKRTRLILGDSRVFRRVIVVMKRLED